MFFLDAPRGTGKTFLINLLLAKVKNTRDIALAEASSEIAIILFEGDRTTHATFKLLLNLIIVETSICSKSKQSNFVKVLKNTTILVNNIIMCIRVVLRF